MLASLLLRTCRTRRSSSFGPARPAPQYPLSTSAYAASNRHVLVLVLVLVLVPPTELSARSSRQLVLARTQQMHSARVSHRLVSPGRADIVDMKPPNMEDLTEVITAAEFHPSCCGMFAFASSKGTVRLCDMRVQALCDKHVKRTLCSSPDCSYCTCTALCFTAPSPSSPLLSSLLDTTLSSFGSCTECAYVTVTHSPVLALVSYVLVPLAQCSKNPRSSPPGASSPRSSLPFPTSNSHTTVHCKCFHLRTLESTLVSTCFSKNRKAFYLEQAAFHLENSNLSII